jgi:hypothetical protein
MSRTGRTLASLALAGGLLAAGVSTADASPGAYSATITASSKGAVYGYTLVYYSTAKYDAATVSGKVTGAVSGDVASLLAKPFRAKAFTPTGMQVTLNPNGSAPVPYSFTVKPALATSYEVQVLTGSSVDVTSTARTVYVASGGSGSDFRNLCSRGHCTYSGKTYSRVPSSAYKTEVSKHWYFYLKLARSEPKYLNLHTQASASKPRKISAGEWVQTMTIHYFSRLRNPLPELWAEWCVKDTERRDGIGLPRPTGCGATRILPFTYVG